MLRHAYRTARVVRWLVVIGALSYPTALGGSQFKEPISVPIKLECSAATKEQLKPPAGARTVTFIVSNTGKPDSCTISTAIDWNSFDQHISPGQTTAQTFPVPNLTKKPLQNTLTIKCDAGKGGCTGNVQIVYLTGDGASDAPAVLFEKLEAEKPAANFTSTCGAKEEIVFVYSGSVEDQVLNVEVINLGDCDVVVTNPYGKDSAKAKKGVKGQDTPSVLKANTTTRINARCEGDSAKDKDKSCKASIKVALSVPPPAPTPTPTPKPKPKSKPSPHH